MEFVVAWAAGDDGDVPQDTKIKETTISRMEKNKQVFIFYSLLLRLLHNPGITIQPLSLIVFTDKGVRLVLFPFLNLCRGYLLHFCQKTADCHPGRIFGCIFIRDYGVDASASVQFSLIRIGEYTLFLSLKLKGGINDFILDSKVFPLASISQGLNCSASHSLF
jgi:hypothetical protein